MTKLFQLEVFEVINGDVVVYTALVTDCENKASDKIKEVKNNENKVYLIKWEDGKKECVNVQ